jgi:hypothetical protein
MSRFALLPSSSFEFVEDVEKLCSREGHAYTAEERQLCDTHQALGDKKCEVDALTGKAIPEGRCIRLYSVVPTTANQSKRELRCFDALALKTYVSQQSPNGDRKAVLDPLSGIHFTASQLQRIRDFPMDKASQQLLGKALRSDEKKALQEEAAYDKILRPVFLDALDSYEQAIWPKLTSVFGASKALKIKGDMDSLRIDFETSRGNEWHGRGLHSKLVDIQLAVQERTGKRLPNWYDNPTVQGFSGGK